MNTHTHTHRQFALLPAWLCRCNAGVMLRRPLPLDSASRGQRRLLLRQGSTVSMAFHKHGNQNCMQMLSDKSSNLGCAECCLPWRCGASAGCAVLASPAIQRSCRWALCLDEEHYQACSSPTHLAG